MLATSSGPWRYCKSDENAIGGNSAHLLRLCPIFLQKNVESDIGDKRVLLQGFYWESYRHGHPDRFPDYGPASWYTLLAHGIEPIADIVINHRDGLLGWAHFAEPAWGTDAVCRSDEAFTNEGSEVFAPPRRSAAKNKSSPNMPATTAPHTRTRLSATSTTQTPPSAAMSSAT